MRREGLTKEFCAEFLRAGAIHEGVGLTVAGLQLLQGRLVTLKLLEHRTAW